jgi:hypothetical protein
MSYRNNMSCGVSVAAVAYMHIKAGHMIKRKKKNVGLNLNLQIQILP